MMTIPQKLKESLEKGQVVPFVGAGVSMAVKNKTDGQALFPSWKALLMKAAEALQKDGKTSAANIVGGMVEQNRLLEAAQEARQALDPTWFGFLKSQLDKNREEAESASLELARRVWKLGSKLVITTNYDKVLRWACPNSDDLAEWDIQAPAEQSELLRNGASKPTVWHLHGRIDNAANIILTPDGYHKLYPVEGKGRYQAALQTLNHQLSSKTFLFIGFSLADEDFVAQLKSVEEIFQGATGPHYVLLAESQRSQFKRPANNIEAVYFSDFGAPMLALLDELSGHAKAADKAKPAFLSGEVGDYSPSKPAFNVPFASKGKQMIGREEALEQVRQQLASGNRTSIGQTAAFQGLGGLGKTQLAVEYAHAYRHDYPNGVIWINADQEIIPQLIKLAEDSRWVSPLSEQSIKVDMAIRRIKEVSGCLLIFDNLENQASIAEFLLLSSANPHILVTSRLDQRGFTPIDLPTLNPEQGLRLLVQVAGRAPDEDEETRAAQAIVERLDGLPLALELAGAYMLRRPSVRWQGYLELLRDDLNSAFPAALKGETFTRHEADIYSTLKIHEVLFEEEPLLKDVLDVLTWSGPASMSVSLLCALLGLDKASALTGALSLGCALRILQKPDKTERYAIHRLVGEVRRAEIPMAERREWAESCGKRLGDWFQARREDFRDLPAYEAELDHLQAWRDNTLALGLNLPAARLVWLQAYPAFHWGRYHEAKQGVEQARALYAQSSVRDGELEAHL